MKGRGQIDSPQEKLPLKSPALLGLKFKISLTIPITFFVFSFPGISFLLTAFNILINASLT